ncbi:MAG: alpha/beta hydrolase [Proteobacteria bacterium]|nr:alpha/beta hydrolase [Pseudomonadota bacterium]
MPFTSVNNARLWHDILGTQGDVILMHHGYTASRVNWMPVAERLSDRYRIVLMECRGTGESEDTRDGYSIEQYGEDAVALMSTLGFQTFTFAGHSMGGGVGMYLGLEHPGRLEKLILMASVGSKGLVGDSFRVNLAERLEARRRNDPEFFLEEQQASRFRADVQTAAWMNSRVDHLMRVSDGHLVDSLHSMQQMDYTDRLKDLRTPTLVLAGGVDPLLDANIEDYRRLPDAALHVLFRAGHDIAVHEPDAVASAIDQFMLHGPINARTLR